MVIAALAYGNNDMIIVPRSVAHVEIDGLWSTGGEWTDASETKIEDNGLVAYLRVKDDDKFLYALVDFVSDHGLERSGDFAAVCFDTKHDKGNTPLLDDYCFYRITRTGEFLDGIIQGNGLGWTVLQEADTWDPYDEKLDASIGYSHRNDPYDSENNHVIYEFRIPIDSYGLDEEMGFYAYVNDAYTKEFIEWPVDAGGKEFKLIVRDALPVPDQWGSMGTKLAGADLSKPHIQVQEKENKTEVRVQAKQVKDLVIVRLRNIDDSTADVHAFRISVHDALLKAAKGPRDWVKEDLTDIESMFSASTNPVHAGEKEYFLLRVEGVKPLIEWIAYGSDNKKLAEGLVTPFS